MHALSIFIAVSLDEGVVTLFLFFMQLSASASRFQHSCIPRAFRNFFGKEGHRRPPSPKVPVRL